MPRQNHHEYDDKNDRADFDISAGQDAVHYHPDRFPDVKRALEILNSTALLDENTACIQYPHGDPAHHRNVMSVLQKCADVAVDHGMRVISFDIDLTLTTGGDYEDNAILIAPTEISRLQALGYIVGTCSDRGPTDQRSTMHLMGQSPHFCIPKEMLEWARKLLPGQSHLHIGDDDRRDRQIAEQAGWNHQWPQDYITPAK